MISGARVHERAEHEQHQHHQQQDRDFFVGDRRERLHGRTRHLQVGEQPAERCRRCDHEEDQARRARSAGDGVREHLARKLAIDEPGHQQRVADRDGRTLDGGEHAGADTDEDQHDEQQSGQRGHETARDLAEAGEALRTVAAPAGDEPDREHQRERHQQCWQDARSEQVCDGDRPAGRGGEQDQVVRRRHQERDERGGDRDVHGEVPVVTAVDHLRDHRAADCRDVGDRGAGHAAEEQRRQHVDLAEPAAQPPDQRGGERDQPVGDAAAQHQFTGEDEQGNRDQRCRAGSCGRLDGDDDAGQAKIQGGCQRRAEQRECHGHAGEQQHCQHAEQDADGHAHSPGGATSGPRTSSSSANSAISAPPTAIGR